MPNKPTRGIRNNNPGNIRKSKDKWQGLAATQPDKSFSTFKTPIYGIRALARILINYYDDHKLDTVTKIIKRWAPPNENDTPAYIKAVCEDTGFKPSQKLDLHTFKALFPMVKAIICHENGYNPYTDAQVTKALVLAGVEPELPNSVAETRTTAGATVAATGVAGSAAAPAIIAEVQRQVEPYSNLSDYIRWALLGLVVLGLVYILYARWDDRRKGLR